MSAVLVATLCDAATVRDGLLNVLGGGITTLWRDSFPAPIQATFAGLLSVPDEEDSTGLEVRVRIRSCDLDEPLVPDYGMKLEVDPNYLKLPGSMKGAPSSVPMIINYSDVGVREPGNYVIEVFVRENIGAEVFFRVGRTEAV